MALEVSVNNTTNMVSITEDPATVDVSNTLINLVLGEGGATSISDAVIKTFTAGEAISGQTVVYCEGGQIFEADTTNVSHFGKVVGVTTNAVAINNTISVVIFGEMVDASFSFTPGPIFFDVTGTPTNTVPTSGFSQQIGSACNTNSLFINIQVPIKF